MCPVCNSLATDVVNSSLERVLSSLGKLLLVDEVCPKLKNRSWTIIKFKRTDVVIKVILVFICPINFFNDLRSKMHQFQHRFLKLFLGLTTQTPLLGKGNPLPKPHHPRRLWSKLWCKASYMHRNKLLDRSHSSKRNGWTIVCQKEHII